MNDIEKNESRFCSCSPALGVNDCLGCLADKIGVHKEIIGSIVELLERLIDDKESGEAKSQPVEMLTIKECAGAVSGLSEHTVRKLVAQGKVKSIRTGEGKRGKILVNKADLLNYFQR